MRKDRRRNDDSTTQDAPNQSSLPPYFGCAHHTLLPYNALAQGAGGRFSPEAPCECTTSLVAPASQVCNAGDPGCFTWATPGQVSNQARKETTVVGVSRFNFHYDNRSKVSQPTPKTWQNSASEAAWPRRQTLPAWQKHPPRQTDTSGGHTMLSSTHATEWVSSP